jgi:allantoinase
VDVAIAADGLIEAVGEDLDEDGSEIDATGLHVFPGGIDSHVHLNEPGRTEWETIASGSAALAAGGYTAYVDMPLNNLPVTVDAAAFDAKLKASRRSSVVDFGLWGGLVPGNVRELSAMHERGAMGFKAFMCPSGIDEFPACDAKTLREGMVEIKRLDSVLLVHAEDPGLLRVATGPTARDFIESRPAEAETSAITTAIELAHETGCRLHVVHVSTARGAQLISDAKRQGVDVSGETCPHYLLYVAEDMERIGGIAKCAPPFRTAGDREALRSMPMIVSDHSPSTLDLKQGDDFSKLWGGISGCQTTRQLLLASGMDPVKLATATSLNIAQRFALPMKGEIAEGLDADLWLVDLKRESTLRRQDLLYRNQFSVHEGRRIRGRTVQTLVRGQPAGRGQFLRPVL